MSSLDSPIDKARLGVITPLYASPYQNLTAWIQLAGTARRYPRIHTIGIVDVRRGPGLGPDEMYKQNIAMLKENGVTVLGYVDTSTDITTDDMKADMKNWVNWYPELDGFYFVGVPRNDDDTRYHIDLSDYAKHYLERKFVVAEFSKVDRPKLPQQFIISSHIDVFVSYRDRVIPAPLYTLKSGIDPERYQAHRFGVMLTKLPVNAHSQNMIVNFIRQCITNNVARYFYFHTDDGARELHPDPFNRISEYLEVTTGELNRIATEEDVLPGTPKGLTATNTERFLIPTVQSNTENSSDGAVIYDNFGIAKLYPNALGDNYQDWYFKQDKDVTKDTRLYNSESAGLKRMQDGSKDNWYINGTNVRLQAASKSEKQKWLNTETTVFFKYLRDLEGSKNKKVQTPYALTLTARNYINNKCYEASVIKEDGRTTLRKQVGSSLYTPTRATQPAITAHQVDTKWVGFKFIVYNIVEEGGKTLVHLETHVLQNCTGPEGQLVIPANQQWKMTSRFIDRGFWGLEDAKVEKKLKNSGKSTDVLGAPSDTVELVCNGVAMVITNWSVREIRVDSTD